MDRRTMLRKGLAGTAALFVSQRGFALERVVTARKTWAIVYGTQCGSSRDAANWINDGLGGIAEVIDVSSGPRVADYEWFIIGGPIQAGRLINPVSNFVATNKAALSTKIMGLFTLCGNSGNANLSASTVKSYLTDQIVQISGVTTKPAKLFPGRSTTACGGMTYDNLKKTECEAFGKAILATAVAAGTHAAASRDVLGRIHTDPLSGITAVSFMLSAPSFARLSVHRLDGKQVASIVSGFLDAGSHTVRWDSRRLSPGWYVYRLNTGGNSINRTIELPAYR